MLQQVTLAAAVPAAAVKANQAPIPPFNKFDVIYTSNHLMCTVEEPSIPGLPEFLVAHTRNGQTVTLHYDNCRLA